MSKIINIDKIYKTELDKIIESIDFDFNININNNNDNTFNLKSNEKNKYYIPIKNQLLISTPTLNCIEHYNQKNNNHILISLNAICLDFFHSIDSKIMFLIKKNLNNINESFPYINNNINYSSLLKSLCDDIEHDNIIDIKLIKKNKFKTIVFDESNKIINLNKFISSINNKTLIKCIINIEGLRVKNNIVSVNFKTVQIKIINNNLIMKNNDNNDDTDNNDNNDYNNNDYVLSDSEN